MKYIIILTALALSASGCSPTPMNNATAQSIKLCLEKNWKPRYLSIGSKVDFTCEPTNIPLS